MMMFPNEECKFIIYSKKSGRLPKSGRRPLFLLYNQKATSGRRGFQIH